MFDLYRDNVRARRLFDRVAANYEGPARAFSLFQYGRWRRAVVSRLNLTEGSSVLDVSTGSGLVAMDIARARRCSVVGVDLSDGMLREGRRNLVAAKVDHAVSLVQGRAERLPFSDGQFDSVVFTFLLRYVQNRQATLDEMARVLRPGGQMVSLEFYVPSLPVLYPLWLLHTRVAMPLGTRLISPGWSDVGSFLGRSISAFYREYSLEDLARMWARAGIGGVRTDVLSLGGAVVTWGAKEDDTYGD